MTRPGRSYQVLHSDAASAELEALGLDSSIFGAMGIPAPIFQALVPRKAGSFDGNAHTFGTADEPATFARASDGVYLDSDGVYKIAAAAAIRAEYSAAGVFLGYLFEPAVTNKCTNYNDAAATTNIALTGDPAATIAVVSDSEIAAQGLENLLDGGSNVFELDNSGGASNANAAIAGTTGNTNTHTLSCWLKVLSGDGFLQTSGASPSLAINTTNHGSWVRVSVSGAPAGSGNQFQIRANAGCVVRFVLNQMEELAVASSPIVTAGSSASRSADSLEWGASGFNSDAGMLFERFIPTYPATAYNASATDVTEALACVRAALFSLSYLRKVSGDTNIYLRAYDHTSGVSAAEIALPVFAANDIFDFVTRWDASNKQVGYRRNSGAWNWSALEGRAGTWAPDGTLRSPYNSALGGKYLSRLALFNVAESTADIERMFAAR